MDAVDERTALISAMLVNSEVGTRLPVEEITAGVRQKNPKTLVHIDAVQGFGKIPLSAKKLGADLISVSGHKIYAPKGFPLCCMGEASKTACGWAPNACR